MVAGYDWFEENSTFDDRLVSGDVYHRPQGTAVPRNPPYVPSANPNTGTDLGVREGDPNAPPKDLSNLAQPQGSPDIVRNPPVNPDGTPTTGGAPTTGGGGYTPYSDQALQDILHKYPPTYEGVQQAAAEANRIFGPGVVTLLDHPTKLDKFVTPTGTYDTVIGAGGPNPQWTWGLDSHGGGAGGGAGGMLGSLSGVGVTPEGRAIVDQIMAQRGLSGNLLGDPMAGRPITDDPSFKFRLDEGLKAMERSAASKGTLLTGGFQKAMQKYAQDVASTEYGASYARRAAEQGNDYNRLMGVAGFMGDQQTNQFNRYYQTAGLGLNATTAGQNTASGYNANIGGAQTAKGTSGAGAEIAKGNANATTATNNATSSANTAVTLGNLAGQAGNYYNNYTRNRVKPYVPDERLGEM